MYGFFEYFMIPAVQAATISSFFLRRSSRDIPGLRARPAVRITMSDPAVSS